MVDQEPKVTWRKYDSLRARIPGEVISQGLESGLWPEETPGWFIDLETRLTDIEKDLRVRRKTATPNEKLLMGIFGERSPRLSEVLSRPPDYATRLRERDRVSLGNAHRTYKEQVDEVFSGLADEDKRILYLSWGLEDGHSRTNIQIGQELGIPRKKVGVRLREILGKLRDPDTTKQLDDYLN